MKDRRSMAGGSLTLRGHIHHELTNFSSRKTEGHHGPGRLLTIMANPRAWEHGVGRVPTLTPAFDDLVAVKRGRIDIAEYRARFLKVVGAKADNGNLAPGQLSVDIYGPSGDGLANNVSDGLRSCLQCALSIAEAKASAVEIQLMASRTEVMSLRANLDDAADHTTKWRHELEGLRLEVVALKEDAQVNAIAMKDCELQYALMLESNKTLREHLNAALIRASVSEAEHADLPSDETQALLDRAIIAEAKASYWYAALEAGRNTTRAKNATAKWLDACLAAKTEAAPDIEEIQKTWRREASRKEASVVARQAAKAHCLSLGLKVGK